uniref:HnRNP K protein n=1 Tax=Dugesia japonica TaxID=6161 RepID=A4V6M2_DUGJA|nr:hnRNP K protein [Dugesia japonica]
MDSSNESSGHSRSKKSQPCIELRFLIPSKAAGSVIGKSGENIRNLRRMFMARINISDNSGPERILSLEADLDTILEILTQCLEKMEGCIPLPRAGSGDCNDSINHVDLRMLVNQSLVGALIGRGGGRINDLREKCDLRVLKVYQTVCPDSTDRIVQLVGAIPLVIDCIGKIVDMCKETPVREPKVNYDAQNYDHAAANHYGGWAQNAIRPNNNLTTRSLGFSRPGFLKHQASYKNEHYDYSYPNNYREMDTSFRNSHYDEQDNNEVQEIRLPHKVVGAIIGPGGSRIQQVRMDSGAHITISSPDRNPQERVVTISGNTQDVKRAFSMINECLGKYGR